MESTVPSHSTARITRSPGKPYGIQVSACVQASSDTAASAGQITGMSNPDGHTARNLVASQSITMAAAPYNIGQSVSAVVETGSVNMRAGYIDWRPATSPDRPKVNTVRTYRNVAVSGPITTAPNRSALSMLKVRLDSGISSLIAAKTSKYPARAMSPRRCRPRNSQAMASAGERITHASGVDAARIPTWATKIS